MKNSTTTDLQELLEDRYRKYNTAEFIESDPVSIPHLFSKKEDIEIAGFLAATISWGNRQSILKNARRLIKMMDNDPYRFITHHSDRDLRPLKTFIHRTFNGTDCVFFIRSLNHIWKTHGGLEAVFSTPGTHTLGERIKHFHDIFFEMPHPQRTRKHVSDPSKKSTAKRLCMFLRWMVRRDHHKVDFGIWKKIRPADLMLPLDVHTGNVSRQLGLLHRKQNDWQAVEEVTAALRRFDPADPVKYDFALFGMGVAGEMARKKQVFVSNSETPTRAVSSG